MRASTVITIGILATLCVLCTSASAATPAPGSCAMNYSAVSEVGDTSLAQPVTLSANTRHDVVISWMDGALAADGNIYAMPFMARSILRIDPTTDATHQYEMDSSTVPSASTVLDQGSKWTGATVVGDCIYSAPRCGKTILKFNVTTHKAQEYEVLPNYAVGHDMITPERVQPYSQFFDAVRANNGMIYAVPWIAYKFLKINPNVDPPTAVQLPSGGNLDGTKWGHFHSAVLGLDGCVYGIPGSPGRTNILKINPVDDSYKFFGDTQGKFAGRGVLGPNGKIYGVPYAGGEAYRVLVIDPAAESLDTIPMPDSPIPGTTYWYMGGVRAPNGKIYGIPYSGYDGIEDTAGMALQIDPDTNKTTLFGATYHERGYSGGVVAPSGVIYGIPAVSRKLLKMGACLTPPLASHAPSGAVTCSHTTCSVVGGHTVIKDWHSMETNGAHHHCVSDLSTSECECLCGDSATMGGTSKMIHDARSNKKTRTIRQEPNHNPNDNTPRFTTTSTTTTTMTTAGP